MADQILSVLFVDDEPLLLDVTRKYLERLGFVVETAESGEQALQMIAGTTFDAIVSDYQMPGMNGIDLLKKIRGKGLDIPFILFTGRGREEVVIEAIDNGADSYVQKGGRAAPQFRELTHKIRAAVQQRKDRRALEASELRFRSLIQNSSDIIRILDRDGTITFDSPSSSTILGYPEGSLVGSRAFDYIHPEDQERVRSDYQDVMDLRNTHIPTEYRIRKADGAYIYVESVALNRIGVPGIDGIITTTHPIQDRKLAEIEIRKMTEDLSSAYEELASSEEELRRSYQELAEHEQALAESEERFRTMAERSSDLILIFDNKPSIIYASPSSFSVSGYEPEEVVGKTAEYAIGTVFSKSIPEFMNVVRKALNGDPVDNVEILMTKKDGSPAVVSMYVVPTNRDGVLTGIQVSMRDITSAKQNEIALRESEAKYRLFADNVSDVIWTTDAKMRPTYISPSVMAVQGLTPEEAMKTPMSKALTPESYRKFTRFHRKWMEMMQKNEPLPEKVVMELEFNRKDGSRIWTEVIITPVYDSNQNFTGVIGVIRDITPRRQAEVALRRANYQLNLLTGITRHDILNNISIIYSYLELVEQKSQDPQLAEYLQVMMAATREIQSQIEFTRVYEELGSHEPQWVRLDAVLPRASLPDSVTMKTNLPDISIYADPMLQRVFFALLDNSIRHGQGVTEIHVSASESKKDLTVTWRDNGVGIAEEEKEKIFQQGLGRNTGLGLFMAREVLSLTGITIRETGTPGEGARFEITVPKGTFRHVNQ